MVHTPWQAGHAGHDRGGVPSHVRCRARTWRVLDRQHDGVHASWRLAREAGTPRLIVSPPDDIVMLPPAVRRVSRRQWTRHAYAMVEGDVPQWWPHHAAALPIDLLAWQFVVAMLMLSAHHRRVLLADEVGMGKTVQAGILLHEIHARAADATTLVVVPAGLVPQWTSELRDRAAIAAQVLDAAALRAEAARPQRSVDAARAGTCWLMSLDLLRRPDVIPLLARTRWTLLVVDEAHHCAPDTARLDAIARVAAASVRVLLLTATPTAAGPAAAIGLRNLGARPGESPMPVIRRAATRIARPPRRVCLLTVALDPGHDALCRRIDAFAERARHESGAAGLLPALVLRRRASSCPAAVARSLARRLEVLRRPVDSLVSPGLFEALTQDARDDDAMHLPAWQDDGAERRELEALLRDASRLPPAGRKLEAVVRLIRRSAEPVVVFTAYLDTLRTLRSLLPSSTLAIVHGEQPDASRTDAVAAFARCDARVLLATDTAAEGLNLHHGCRLVVHAELPVSPRQLEQRTGRLDRYGQRHRVHAVVMGSRTLDDRQAAARLAARAADDDAWVASVVSPHCRRTELADRTHAAWRRPRRASQAQDDHDVDAVALCELRPRQWQRLADRLGLPRGTSSLCVGRLRATGGPELTASSCPVLLCGAGVHEGGSAPAVDARWPASLRGFVKRVRRRAVAIAGWEREAEHAAAREESSGPDLFADARADTEVTTRRQPPEFEAAITLEPAAIVTRRTRVGESDAPGTQRAEDSRGEGGDR